jgi:hypothetical protein
MTVTDRKWRLRLTGWNKFDGAPATLHFKEIYNKPTKEDIAEYVQEQEDRLSSRWEFVTVEVQIFYEIKDFQNTFI